jgi:hypothetical protein
MFATSAESHIPIEVARIQWDIDLHVRNGWNFTGADADGNGAVVLRYSRQRGHGASQLDPTNVSNAVVSSLGR